MKAKNNEPPIHLDRRRILTIIGSVISGSLIGCGGGGSTGTSNPTSASSTANATVSLLRSSPGATLTSRFIGLSYEKNTLSTPLFSPLNFSLIELYALLGPGVLRIGANAVDKTSWMGRVSGLPAIDTAGVDALVDFVRATGWQVIYGINLANNTLENAADEAIYVSSRLGTSLLGFEIGNEPDVYHSNGLRATTWTYADFLTEWRQMRDVILASVPGANFVGPASAYDYTRYTVPFAHDAASGITMLTHHYYRANGQDPSSTLNLLLQPDPRLPTILQALNTAARTNNLTGGFRMGECNSYYNGGAPNISNAYGSALWVLDYMFTCALKGCQGVNFHGGGNGPGYTPIADSKGVVQAARAEFYGLALFAKAAEGIALPSSVQMDAGINFTAYGVARNDGGINVVLINKDPDRYVQVALDLGVSATSLQSHILAGAAIDSPTGALLDGAMINPDGSWLAQSPYPYPVHAGKASITVSPINAVLLRSV